MPLNLHVEDMILVLVSEFCRHYSEGRGVWTKERFLFHFFLNNLRIFIAVFNGLMPLHTKAVKNLERRIPEPHVLRLSRVLS